jgi:predicted nucleic acid-binding protein
VKQMEIFDLQLVATMISNQVKQIYTVNRDDFVKFTEIEVLEL